MPTSSAAHGSTPERRPARCWASTYSDAKTSSSPSTLTGNAPDFQPLCPCRREFGHVGERDCPGHHREPGDEHAGQDQERLVDTARHPGHHLAASAAAASIISADSTGAAYSTGMKTSSSPVRMCR